VFVDASVRQCPQRVHDRGVWDRLAHRQPAEVDQFVGNAHHTVSLTRREIGGRGWPVIDVDNGTIDPETARAALRRELAQTFFLSESTAEGRPA
jgi:hypothetical protein